MYTGYVRPSLLLTDLELVLFVHRFSLFAHCFSLSWDNFDMGLKSQDQGLSAFTVLITNHSATLHNICIVLEHVRWSHNGLKRCA